MPVRERIERWFEGLGRAVYDHPWVTLALIAVMTLPLVAQLPKITVDNRTENLFLEGDATLVDYQEFRDLFGTDEYIVVAANPAEVFDLDFLSTLRRLHQELEEKTPFVAEVTSLVNARHTYGAGEVLVVEDLLHSWPETADDLAALRQRVLANPFYVNRLISEDGSFATILIRPRSAEPTPDAEALDGFDDLPVAVSTAGPGGAGQLTSREFAEMVTAVRGVLEGYDDAGFPLYLAGGPVVADALNRAVPEDMARILPLAFLVVMTFLFLLFRRVSGVVYPILIVMLALLSTLGVMGAAEIAFTNITTMLSSFLTVVGVADAVHILSYFYQRYGQHEDKREAIAEALGHSGLAVLMTSVTTAAGLLSFAAADVGPIADLGVVAPIGIAFALVLTIALLPTLIAIFPVSRRPEPGHRTLPMGRFLAWVAQFSCAHTRTILVIGVVVALAAIAGMTRLRFSQNGLKWFKEDAAVRRATEIIDDSLGGTLTLEVVIDTGTSDGLLDPGFLARLEESLAWAESQHSDEVWVGKATSLDTVVKEINRALHGNREEFYAIPEDRQLIAQELLLFEGTGSDDLETLVDRDFSMVRCTLSVPFRDGFHYLDLIADVSTHFRDAFPRAEVTVTGSMALLVRMFRNVISTMAKSYVISMSIITVLMVLLIGRLRVGLLSMVPNLLPLMAILGVMGWLDIPLDMSTVLIGSIAIGLVVDDTIHFMHNFRRDFERFGNVSQAVAQTLETAGRAILITSVVLAGGFMVCMVSELRSTVIYGGLMATTVILALAADYFVTPALLAVVHRHLGAGRGGQGNEVEREVAA